MNDPHKTKIKLFIGSLSRAIGNELVDYAELGGETTLQLWPPISLDNKVLIKSLAKIMIPNKKIHFKRNSGTVKIY